ncbi:hypothetical protein [Maridesulfovibrio sp.]|uniref:hypothetical protein n=1 Tax=Maridesulfovibrio sp. TaxID=2795000 RepID=UPI0039EE9B1A
MLRLFLPFSGKLYKVRMFMFNKNSEYYELAADVGDSVVDLFSDSEFIEKLPGFGLVYKIIKTGISIPDRLFINKLTKFIEQIENVSDSEKKEMLNRFEKDGNRERIGTTLMLVLNNVTELIKAEILARIFIKYLQNEISEDEFFRLSHATDKCYVNDLSRLAGYATKSTSNPTVAWGLVSSGLAENMGIDIANSTTTKSGKSIFKLTHIGRIMSGIIFEMENEN